MDLPSFSLDLSALAGLGSKHQPDPTTEYDLIIVGGGPAAMAAAIYGARKTLKLAIIAKEFGGQVASTSEIENYLGFQSISGKELVNRFNEQIGLFDIPALRGQKVDQIRKEGDWFKIQTEDQRVFSAATVILATGKHDRPLGVPGEKELAGKGVAYCSTCDAPFYKGQDVLVVGGGNSAFTAALDLVKVQARVTMVNNVSGWQADEIMQKSLQRQEPAATLLANHEVVSIHGVERVDSAWIRDLDSSLKKEISIKGIFVEIGLIPNSEPVKGLVKLSALGEVIIDCHCQTNLEGLFGAGDVTTVPHKQIIISAGEGAKAALSAYTFLAHSGRI